MFLWGYIHQWPTVLPDVHSSAIHVFNYHLMQKASIKTVEPKLFFVFIQ